MSQNNMPDANGPHDRGLPDNHGQPQHGGSPAQGQPGVGNYGQPVAGYAQGSYDAQGGYGGPGGYGAPPPPQRNTAKTVLIVVFSGIGLFVVCCCGGGLALSFFGMQQTAKELRIQYGSHPAVTEHIGNIQDLSLSWTDSQGDSIVYDVVGDKGSGQISAKQSTMGQLSDVELLLPDGSSHDLTEWP